MAIDFNDLINEGNIFLETADAVNISVLKPEAQEWLENIIARVNESQLHDIKKEEIIEKCIKASNYEEEPSIIETFKPFYGDLGSYTRHKELDEFRKKIEMILGIISISHSDF